MAEFSWRTVVGEEISTPEKGIDPDKWRTATKSSMRIMGVEISSRYGKHHELVEMAEVIAGMPPALRALIKSIWCDSKATNTFSVDLKPGMDVPFITEQIGACLHGLIMNVHGGHNGIYVGENYEVASDWSEYFEDEDQ